MKKINFLKKRTDDKRDSWRYSQCNELKTERALYHYIKNKNLDKNGVSVKSLDTRKGERVMYRIYFNYYLKGENTTFIQSDIEGNILEDKLLLKLKEHKENLKRKKNYYKKEQEKADEDNAFLKQIKEETGLTVYASANNSYSISVYGKEELLNIIKKLKSN